MQRFERARWWGGWLLVAVSVLGLVANVYARVSSCLFVGSPDVVPNAGSSTTSPWSLSGCTTEYGLLDGTTLVRAAPPDLTLLCLAGVLLGITLAGSAIATKRTRARRINTRA